jgi:dGTPase
MGTARPDLFALDADQQAVLRERCQREEAALSPAATHNAQAIYEFPTAAPDDPTDILLRPAFVRDVDRILNNAFYNRCMDKTQVFPFFRNDDVSRRSFHLQLVAQISLKIGRALGLNEALIQAIALGHDLGHTPFGHGGEHMLDRLLFAHTDRPGHPGIHFSHNVQSVRLLRSISTSNLSLQTYNGILAHCGEKAFARYEPAPCATFADLDAMIAACQRSFANSQLLRPSTLEGCVVRLCDILAYLGKDRQDAVNLGVLTEDEYRTEGEVAGATNADYIRNTTLNLIKNSLGKDYLALDPELFESLMRIKDDNARRIYRSPEAHARLDELIEPMMTRIYERCLEDLRAGDRQAPVFRHHLDAWVMRYNPRYAQDNEPAVIVADYIACMTDEYFIDLHNYLFPRQAVGKDVLYHPYF